MWRELLSSIGPDVTQGEFPENVIGNHDMNIDHITLPQDKKTLENSLAQVDEYISTLSPADTGYKLDRANMLKARIETDLSRLKK
jgi:hypothetical protein